MQLLVKNHKMERFVNLIKKIFLSSCLILSFVGTSIVFAASDAPTPPKNDWKHRAILGTFDRAAAQRGFQVYKENCSSCHSLGLLSYRNLEALGFNELESKAIASEYSVIDGPNDDGEMFERPGIAADRFVGPYANEKAARAANNGAYPPDLSLIAKARPHGEDYLYAVLTGYEEPPQGMTPAPGMYWNKYFPGHQIAMPPMIIDGAIAYADGTPSTVEQQAYDVSVFLTWAADPHLEKRMAMGLKTFLFLLAFSVLMYFVKRKVWEDVK